jgi:phage terminase large subunit-like protein
VFGAGTPGPDIDSPLYLIRRLVRDGAIPPSFFYREFSGEPGVSIRNERNWHRANPSLRAGMPDISFLRNAVVMTPEVMFRTYHLAEFDVVGHDSWLGPDARALWKSLEDPLELVPGALTYVGVDVGLVRDSTAVVAVQRREDGRLHARAKVWAPMPDQTVDILEVVQYLRDLATDFKVVEISYDPRLFELPAQMLTAEKLPMVEIPQSIERMTPIVGALFELIHRAGLSHDADPVLSEHVVGAVPWVNDRGYTLAKSKSKVHIDACIALALAVDRAQHPKKQRSPVVVL